MKYFKLDDDGYAFVVRAVGIHLDKERERGGDTRDFEQAFRELLAANEPPGCCIFVPWPKYEAVEAVVYGSADSGGA